MCVPFVCEFSGAVRDAFVRYGHHAACRPRYDELYWLTRIVGITALDTFPTANNKKNRQATFIVDHPYDFKRSEHVNNCQLYRVCFGGQALPLAS